MIMKMLESTGAVHTHTSNLIEGKSQAFLCFICDIYERQIKVYLSFLYFYMKKENGITLVALVISIIILLILATISVQVLTGDNGLLTKSKYAVDKYSD